ncbi:unnamed protein product [Protopolystoma xenopodis]|uniref:Uncharacterized protein n=1 Tax=Protopolystoma xenopodis TaxID=117903 RepID=A0A3S5CHI2_9PLAT|nr:unnamed protein product [Protopolystoma xenopodis]
MVPSACETELRKEVRCNRKTCRATETERWKELQNCRCIPRRRVATRVCCCPPTQVQRRCLHNGRVLVTERTTYAADAGQQQCVASLQRDTREIVCQRQKPQILARYCDRKSCRLVHLLRRVVKRGCNCHQQTRRDVQNHLRCCCRPPRFQRKCFHKYGVVQRVSYRYSLFQGQCLTKKYVDQDKIVCEPERKIDGPCDSKAKLRSVITVRFERNGCECVRKVSKKEVFCGEPDCSIMLKDPRESN